MHNDPGMLVLSLLGGMVAILIVGSILGKFLSGKTAGLAYLGLGVLAAFGIWHDLIPMFAGHQMSLGNFPKALLWSMGPLYLGMGLHLGRYRRSVKESYLSMLAGWQKQMDQDLANQSNELLIVHDLRTIAELYHYYLDNNDEAVKALDRAYAIVGPRYAEHASMSSLLRLYASVLRQAKRKEEAQKVSQQADRLPKLLLSMPSTPRN
ncbi:MAG TPA: hypothetical protein V6C81_26755 [Planktothrix sp.]|jgi:hypothetical protein